MNDSDPQHDPQHDPQRGPDPWADFESGLFGALAVERLDEDVAAAEVALESTPASFALSAHAQVAARAAFAASCPGDVRSAAELADGVVWNGQGSARVRETPLEVRAPRMHRSRVWVRAAAAMLIVGLALFAVWGGSAKPVEAGISLRTVQRIDEAEAVRRMPAVERGRVASMGEVFRAARHELLALEMDRASLFVLRDGDTLRVDHCACAALVEQFARVAPADRRLALDSDVLFHLDSGEVRVAAGDRPMPIWIPRAGLLVVTRGAAHVVADVGVESVSDGPVGDGPGWASQRGDTAVATSRVVPAIALAHDSEAFFVRAARFGGGADIAPIRLAAGERVLLTHERVESFGHAAQSLFRELQFFGGVVPNPPQAISVPAQRWHVRGGTATLRAEGVRFDLKRPLTVAWRVPVRVEQAQVLRVAVRGPVGVTVRVAALGVSAQIAEASSGQEPGVSVVALPLPAQWADTLDGHPLEIEILAEGGQAEGTAWFDGAVFVVPGGTQ